MAVPAAKQSKAMHTHLQQQGQPLAIAGQKGLVQLQVKAVQARAPQQFEHHPAAVVSRC
jgi:hypothetical protein